jgi:two-component system, LytTR family, response regulator
MTELRAVIVDDEPLAREGMRLHLEAEPGIEVVGEAADGAAAIDLVRDVRPDLLFLDVQMPGLNGFDVVEQLGADDLPAVIFVTAWDRFALRAFDAHAIDYLLKPVDPERLRRALERARQLLAGEPRRSLEERIHALLQGVGRGADHLSRVVVRHQGRILLVRVDDIDWIEAASNYVQIHVRGKSFTLRETMGRLEERLDPAEFLRIHRSLIVRIDRIREMEPLLQGDYLIVLADGTRLTSSRSYRQRIRDLLRTV